MERKDRLERLWEQTSTWIKTVIEVMQTMIDRALTKWDEKCVDKYTQRKEDAEELE